MVKSTKTKKLDTAFALKETPLEKTSRVSKSMIEDAAEQRKTKMERLRKSRLEREASVPAGNSKAQKDEP